MTICDLNVYDIGESPNGKAPRTKEHLALYCLEFLNTRIPHPAKCEGHSSPLDAIWMAYSEQEDFSIWHAMRGSGKTYDLAILAWLESLFKKSCGTTILGGSLEQSTKAIAYLSYLWSLDSIPKDMLKGGQVFGRGYALTNGSWVQALAASTKSVRGPHPQKLRLDEVDEMDELIFDAALGQPKSNYGIRDQIVASSTVHNPFGLMSRIIDTKEERNGILHRWCTKELVEPRGFWSREELLRRKGQVTQAMWDAEYKLLRPSTSNTIYDFELVQLAWERGKDHKWNEKVATEAGIDWGLQTTVMHIIQDHKDKITVPETYEWNMIELTERCALISDLCIIKKITTLYVDISPNDSNFTLMKVLEKNRVQTRVTPIAFGKWKNIAIKVVQYLLEKKMLDITDKEFKKKMQEYHFKNPEQEQIAKEDDHYPDALTSWAASRYKLLGG